MLLKNLNRTLIILVLLGTSIIAQHGIIKVKITGIEDHTGQISIGLFDSPKDFPKKNSNSVGIQVEVKDSTAECTFNNLKNGIYAIAVYHDINSNGKLDRNWLGIPSEDYVFSNYATGNFGPPSFEDAKFELIDSLSIELNIQK